MKCSTKIIPALLLFFAAALALSGLPAAGQHSSSDNQAKTQTEQLAKTDINREKQQAQQNAKQSLNQEAIAAVAETRQAIDAINAKRNDQALTLIEQATGKINVLVARNPASALIPVSAEVDVIDTAPTDIGKIRSIATDTSWAVEGKNFPAARALLDQLVSEIRVRTYNLPLATYPAVLQEAARLLDRKKPEDAANALRAGLATLVAIDKVTPIPIIVAQEAVKEAQTKGNTDKNSAETLLQVAKNELQRARELGYAGKDQEYAALNDEISNVKKQLNGGGDLSATYAKLKERLSAFLHRQSQQQNGQPQPQRTAEARNQNK